MKNQIENAARWIGASGPGHWADADMLPIGSLRPVAGWGDPRETRLTRDEQRTLLTFWCIVRSPLMMGGNLLSLDPWTLSLLTNDEVLAVDQQASESRRALETPDLSVWISRAESAAKSYVAVMNLADAAQSVHRPWADLGLRGPLAVRDLWERRDLGSSGSLDVTLPPHGAALLAVQDVR